MSEGLNFQRFIDAVTDAFRARDFEAFGERIALPLTVFSYDGTAVVNDTEALRHYFETYAANLDRHGVTDTVRVATSFYEIGACLASCTYDTHLFRDGQRIVEPFASAATLRHADGRWRVVSIMSALPHARSWFREHSLEALLAGRTEREEPRATGGPERGAP